MADFSRLPNEMISVIWSNIQEPEDVESFALVSKHVYAIGRPFVNEHNKLKKEFSFFEADSEVRTGGAAKLLKEVLLRPRIALYVTHLSIGGGDADDGWPNDGHVPYPDNVMALLIETIQNSSFVPQDDSRWIRGIEEGDEDPIFALLCTLLPNLIMVTLGNGQLNATLTQDTILRIAEAEKTVFLTRLVTVKIVGRPEEHGMDWDWLRAFTALPSVQSIHFDDMGIEFDDADNLHLATDPENTADKAQYFLSDSYSIRELSFTNSSLHPKILAQLLDSVKGLKEFSYDDPNGTWCEFKPFWIRIALLANAKHSLEYLAVLPPSPEQLELLGDLRGFTTLKELETHVHLLCHESPFDGLAGLLPSSIETLCLYMADNEVPRVVEEIVKEKSRLIPHLKMLKLVTKRSWEFIGGDGSVNQSLEEKCQNVGTELTFIEDNNSGKAIGRSRPVEC